MQSIRDQLLAKLKQGQNPNPVSLGVPASGTTHNTQSQTPSNTVEQEPGGIREEERQMFEEIGGFYSAQEEGGGIKPFDIACQNRRELIMRVKETAIKQGFSVWLKYIKHGDNGKIDFKFVCCMKRDHPGEKDKRLMLSHQCKFFLHYQLNIHSQYFTLTDYDELHNHPLSSCTEKIKRLRLNFRNLY